MAANDITIGSHNIPPHLCAGDHNIPPHLCACDHNIPGANTDIGTVYQAGFEAGFAQGKGAGLKEARDAAAAVMCAATKNAAASAQPHVEPDRFLLGLPCQSCGAYYGS